MTHKQEIYQYGKYHLNNKCSAGGAFHQYAFWRACSFERNYGHAKSNNQIQLKRVLLKIEWILAKHILAPRSSFCQHNIYKYTLGVPEVPLKTSYALRQNGVECKMF